MPDISRSTGLDVDVFTALLPPPSNDTPLPWTEPPFQHLDEDEDFEDPPPLTDDSSLAFASDIVIDPMVWIEDNLHDWTVDDAIYRAYVCHFIYQHSSKLSDL
jgi:hypothetical protein